LGVFKFWICRLYVWLCPGPIYHSPDPLQPDIGNITILGVAVAAIVEGEKVKFPGAEKEPVKLQFEPLDINDMSATALAGWPEATLRLTIGFTYCHVVD
jgi:hypothetical protein